MSIYKSVDDILASKDKKAIREELKNLNIDHHHAEKTEVLATKLFEALGGAKEEPAKGQSDEFWLDLIKEAESTSKSKKADSPDKMATFVSKNHNLWESPTGNAKSGKPIRYAEGIETLDIAEQEESGVPIVLKKLLFKGIDHPLPDDKFKGKGVFRTKIPALKEFLRTNKNFGIKYAEYKPHEIRRERQEKDEKITLIKAGMYKASDEHLIQIISFLDLRKGNDTFSRLHTMQTDELRMKCIAFIENDIDGFAEAMKGKMSKMTLMVNKARMLGIIKLNTEETEVLWADNAKPICRSSRTSSWQHDLISYLATPDGRNIFDKISERTSVYF